MDGPQDSESQRQPLLFSLHEQLGARFSGFAGWLLPISYGRGTIAECDAVRTRAGVFDVSHLGRAWLEGPGAGAALRSVTTHNVLALAPGKAHYSLYCNALGGIDDDVFVYRLGDERWLIIHNAANSAADLQRLRDAGGPAPEDVTGSTVMLAVQGPAALGELSAALATDLGGLRRHECRELRWAGGDVLIVRTGYTGEDGAECILDATGGASLLAALAGAGVEPAGLAARDVLRLEAALPLHGHDIHARTNPYEAGLGWVVSLDDLPFTGRDALREAAGAPPAVRLACLRTPGRAVLREGYPVTDDRGDEVAVLTSGTFSPTLGYGIGLAYLPAALSEPGTTLRVRVRSADVPVTVVPRPFYKRR